MGYRTQYENLQNVSDLEHYQNLLKIIRFDFWSDDERAFFLQMYDGLIVQKTIWEDMSTRDYLTRFFEVLR